MRLTLRLLVLLVIALVPVALSSCGGNENVDDVLKETFGKGKKVSSGKLNVSLNFEGKGSPQLNKPVTLKLDGPFQSQGVKKLPKFDFSLGIGASGSNFSAGAVSTGDKGFLKLQSNTYAITPQIFDAFKKGFEQASNQREGSEQNPSFQSLGIDPRNWLTDPKNEGTEDVGGTETIHISAGVDVGRLLQDVNKILKRAGSLGVTNQPQVPTELSASQRKQVEEIVTGATFDLWTGKDDKTLRKLSVDLDLKLDDQQRQRLAGLQSGELGFTLQIDELNKDQTIRTPVDARPFAELRSQVGQLRGLGLGGGAGGATGGTGSGAAPAPAAPAPDTGTGGAQATSPQAQAYINCVQQAQGDIAKAQKCANLLTGP